MPDGDVLESKAAQERAMKYIKKQMQHLFDGFASEASHTTTVATPDADAIYDGVEEVRRAGYDDEDIDIYIPLTLIGQLADDDREPLVDIGVAVTDIDAKILSEDVLDERILIVAETAIASEFAPTVLDSDGIAVINIGE